MMPSKVYQDHIKICRELAKEAQFPEVRNLLLKIADTWNWIADDDEIPIAEKNPVANRRPQSNR